MNPNFVEIIWKLHGDKRIQKAVGQMNVYVISVKAVTKFD